MTSTAVIALALALATPPAGAAATWGVSASGSATADVGDGESPANLVAHGQTNNFGGGGYVQQPVASGNTDAVARGVITKQSQPDFLGLQAADGSAMARASLGELHAATGADSTISDFVGFTTLANGSAGASWFDTLTFHTNNPLGSIYTYSITLHDSLSTSVAPNSQGVYTHGDNHAQATTELDIQSAPGINGAEFLRITDYLAESGVAGSHDPATLTEQPPDSRTATGTVRVFDGTVLTFYQYLSLSATSAYENGTAGANASDTAFFNLVSSDAGASYASASGMVYPTSSSTTVPLMPSGAFMLAALGALGCVPRRDRATRSVRQ